VAKISVSIPDELKARLDVYADETGFTRSGAVSHVLEAFFADEVRSPEAIDPERVETINRDLAQTRKYLEALHERDPENFPRPEWLPPDEPDTTIRSFITRRPSTDEA
jgi:hypothetical protein